MLTNIGQLDRVVRIAAGVLILALYFVLDEGLRLWALLGLVPLLTGLAGTCPLYSVLGINTCARPRSGAR